MRRAMRVLFCILTFTVFFVNNATASGVYVYRDDFRAGSSSAEKVYNNIRPYTHPANPSVTYGAFADGADSSGLYWALATYNLSGVQTMRLGLYSSLGTQAHNDRNIGWTLGAPDTGLSLPAYIFPDMKIYARINGILNMLRWDNEIHHFRFYATEIPVDAIPLAPYGVHVYTGGPGVELTRTSAAYLPHPIDMYYEEFSANIAPGVSSITVYMTDVLEIARTPQRAMGLSFVEFTLRLPDLEPPPVAPPVQPSSSAPASSSRAASSSSRSSSSSQSRSSSEYFVGTPMPLERSSSSSSRNSSSSQSRSSAAPDKTSSVSASTQSPAGQSEIQHETASEVAVYRSERPQGDSGPPFVAGAAVYITLAGTALAAVVLRGRGK